MPVKQTDLWTSLEFHKLTSGEECGSLDSSLSASN